MSSRVGSRGSSPTNSESGSIASSSKTHPLLVRRSSSTTTALNCAVPLINFAQQGNPTLQINLTRRYSFQLTYAEVLQYACILLSTRQLTILSSSGSSSSQHPRLSGANGVTEDGDEGNMGGGLQAGGPMGGVFIYLNLGLLLCSLASLGVRRRAEGLGLRRTSLLLCVLLFLLTCLVIALGHLSSLSSDSIAKALMASEGARGGQRWVGKGGVCQRVFGGLLGGWHNGSTQSHSLQYCPPSHHGEYTFQLIHPSCTHEPPSEVVGQDESAIEAAQALFRTSDDKGSLVDGLCAANGIRPPSRHRLRLYSKASAHSLIVECDNGNR